MTQLKKTVAKRFGQRLTVILTITKFCQASNHGSEVVWITGFQFVQELPHRAATGRRLIELYDEIHLCATSILMYSAEA